LIKVVTYGRIGAEPVQRETRAGKPICTASLAVNVAKQGEEPSTEWINLAAFGAVGEALAQHEKGDLLTAMGTLTRSKFTGRDGQERAGWNLLVESLLSPRAVRPSGTRRQTRTPPRPTALSSHASHASPRFGAASACG
jgi:single-strand DNA-binding protein